MVWALGSLGTPSGNEGNWKIQLSATTLIPISQTVTSPLDRRLLYNQFKKLRSSLAWFEVAPLDYWLHGKSRCLPRAIMGRKAGTHPGGGQEADWCCPGATHSCAASRKASGFSGKSGSFASMPHWQNRTQDQEGPMTEMHSRIQRERAEPWTDFSAQP